MKLKFSKKEETPSELLKKVSPIPTKVKHSHLQIYAGESKLFSHYELPVITSTGVLLSHIEDVQAAELNGNHPIDVLVVENLNESEYLRFSLKTIYFKGMKDAERMELIRLITSHFETEEGKLWKASLIDAGHSDINKQISAILGCSWQLIKQIRSKLNKDPEKKVDECNEDDYTVKNEQLAKEDIQFSYGNNKLTFTYKGEKQDLYKFTTTEKNGHFTLKFKISELKIALEKICS